MGCHKMVNEFLIKSFGEHSLFPEARGQVDVGLGDSIKGDLAKLSRVAAASWAQEQRLC